jgi:hypothetical protein
VNAQDALGEELYFEFGKKIESLRIMEKSARRALSWCRCAQKELLFDFRKEKKCQEEDLHRVTEHPAGSARSA